MNPLLDKRQEKATPAERIAAYDRERWKAILAENARNPRNNLAIVRNFIDAIERAPNVGGDAGLAPLLTATAARPQPKADGSSPDVGGPGRLHIEAAWKETLQLVTRLRRAHAESVQDVAAEDRKAEEERAAAAAAEALAVAEKEARRRRFEELKALEAEFGKVGA